MHALSSGMSAVQEGSRTWDVVRGIAEKREFTLRGCISWVWAGRRLKRASPQSPCTLHHQETRPELCI